MWQKSTSDAASILSALSGSSDGVGGCASPAMDNTGAVVAFDTPVAGLVAGDTNGTKDVFVRDTGTLTTTRVSVDSLGAEAHGDSTDPALSGDGRYVAYASTAADLVTGDGNGTQDIFLFDRQLGSTVRISVTSAAVEFDLGKHHLTLLDTSKGRLVTDPEGNVIGVDGR